MSDLPLVSPKVPGGHGSASAAGLPPGYRLNLDGVASSHGGQEAAAAVPREAPQRRRKADKPSRQGKAPKEREREKGEQPSHRRRRESKERRKEAGRGGGDAAAFNGFVSQSRDFPEEVMTRPR